MRKCVVLLAVSLALAPLTSAFAQSPALNAKVDALFAKWDKTDSPGLALAVVRDGNVVHQRGYGLANLELGLAISSATVFFIASLSKHFAVFCILMLAQGGSLNLDDDVRKHVPEVPDFGKTITVRQLIHHTSGLREYLPLASYAGCGAGDVITERDLLDLVSKQKELNFDPGSQHLYCNTGYELLGIIVKRVSGKSLREYAHENLFQPLGMKHTQFRDNHLTVIPGFAASYGPKPGGGWQYGLVHHGLAGASNLHTTVEDLAIWDRNFYDAKVGGRKVVDQMHDKFKLNDGVEINYAGGLNVAKYRGLKTVDHTGSHGGFRTILLRFPEQKFSVIVLANAADVQVSGLARKVADLYLEKELKDEKKEEKKDSKKDKSTMLLQVDGEERLVDWADSITLGQPPKLTDEQRQAFVGGFYSDELEVMYQVTERAGRLWVRHRKGEFALEAVQKEPDEFVGNFGEYGGIVNLRFVRNDEKRVTGFTLGSGRVKHLKFTRAEIKKVS